ncbi:MAG: transporter substrate-binding domain-containing protein [Pseudomonadota bacterium]
MRHFLFATPLLVLGASLLLAGAALAQTVRIGSWDRTDDPLTTGSEAVLVRAYAELGLKVEFVDLPIRRAMGMLQNGELDGNLHRIAAIAEDSPTLLRLSTPINAMVVRVYAPRAAAAVLRWNGLAAKRVAYRRGVLMIERSLGKDVRRIEARNDAEAFRMVAAGVADVMVAVEPPGAETNGDAQRAGLVRQEAMLEEVPLYHYLHVQQRDRAAALDAILQRMEASGEMGQIRRHALASRP